MTPVCNHETKTLYSIEIRLTTANHEIKEIANEKLRELGFKTYERYKAEMKRRLNGRIYKFGRCWDIEIKGWQQAEKFAQLIGFRVIYRDEVLLDLLKLRRLPPRARYETWMKWYYKDEKSGRWRKSLRSGS